ncbi:helix-turn-helix domain-containing protein [Haladaptatus sp. DYF46]|uniref:helix-turn-helix domain-containing protein n=1 Tax=Haladaptatus sp. DYF46 TaxID=2886041 RepID=UPI001E542D61|nr:helix-turn-helix domain-containing protein [Haladaptatus sp. DYF46]
MTGTIVEVTIPSEQFALEHTLTEFETLTFEVEQMVAMNRDTLMPFIWIDSSDLIRLETAFRADESVAEFERIADFETDCLYQLTWVDRISHLIRILVDEKGTVMSATGYDDTWHLRLLFADRDAATRTNAYCEEQGIDFGIENIHEFTNHSGSRVGVTDPQQETLQLAAERGYYTVPREATAEDLAKEFGISHQALSERLRRGHGALVTHVFGGSAGTSESPEPADTTSDKRSAPSTEPHGD